tara:strand:+ start:4643 stop:7357 length:2715 start_codon:yes stop_codon:yes gene_type:complete
MAKRVLLGKKGSDYGLFISKPGVDVTTTTSPKDLLFNSGATTTASGATSEKSFRSGIIVNDTTLNTLSSGATKTLPSTLGSDNNYYIPAYQIVENGVRNPTSGYNESRNPSGFALYEIDSHHLSGLPSNTGGGLWELTTAGSGANINAIEAKQIDATQYENSNATSFAANYPWIADRAITTNDSVSVDILMLRIPCQYGKMEIDALFNTTTQPTINTSGGGGSGGSPSAPTISSVSRIARDTSNDTVRISASSGSNNSGTITYGVNNTNTAPTSFQSSADFTQPRNSTRYYFAKQGGVASSGTQYDAAAVDTTPNAFTFTTKNSATAGQSFSQASSTIAGLADGDSASVSVSNGSVTPSSVVNGDTVTATGTAASAGGQTVVTVTIGGVQGTFTINTPAPTPSDNSPDEFGNFTPATGSEVSTVNTSNSKTITDIDVATAVSISGNGSFSIAGGSYVTSGNITNNQSITVRLTSSGSFNTSVSTTLTVGDKTGDYTVTTRSQVTASPPTALTLTQTTNTSGTSQTVTATGSGGTGTTQVSNDGSNWQSNGHSFSQNRSGSAVTYYARNVGEANSSNFTATKLVPPVVTLSAIGVFNANSSSANNTYNVNTQRANGNFNTYSSSWGTVSTSISNNSGGWLTSSITNSSSGSFNLTTAANSSTSARNATVTYTTTTQFGHTHTMTFTYNQAGVTPDTTPDQFTFSDVGDRALNTDTFANDQITGINTATNATYSGDANGSFSVTGINGTYNQSAKSVSNGTQIHVKITSSSSNSTARSATITVGGVSDTFTVTTEAASDTTPDQFSFSDEVGALSTTVYTDTITLAGFNAATTASMSSSAVSSGFKVNSGSFGTGSQTVNVGDTITAFVRSAAGSFQSQSITITVGGVSDTFSVLTGNTGGGGGIE